MLVRGKPRGSTAGPLVFYRGAVGLAMVGRVTTGREEHDSPPFDVLETRPAEVLPFGHLLLIDRHHRVSVEGEDMA